MTDLATVALEFAREVLGWEDVTNVSETGRVYPKACWSPVRALDFRFTDLNSVMDAVRSWCDRSGCQVELRYSPDQAGFGVLCEGVDTWDADPCHALMAACVEASRKLKAAR